MRRMSNTLSRRQLLATLGGAVCARAVLAGQQQLVRWIDMRGSVVVDQGDHQAGEGRHVSINWHSLPFTSPLW